MLSGPVGTGPRPGAAPLDDFPGAGLLGDGLDQHDVVARIFVRHERWAALGVCRWMQLTPIAAIPRPAVVERARLGRRAAIKQNPRPGARRQGGAVPIRRGFLRVGEGAAVVLPGPRPPGLETQAPRAQPPKGAVG